MSCYDMPPGGDLEGILGMVAASLLLEDEGISNIQESCTPFPVLVFLQPVQKKLRILPPKFVKPGPSAMPLRSINVNHAKITLHTQRLATIHTTLAYRCNRQS